MAPPRWHAGWTGQPPIPPPADVQANPLSTVLRRVNGVGPWVTGQLGQVGIGDTVLTLEFGQWEPQLPPGPPDFGTVLVIPVT